MDIRINSEMSYIRVLHAVPNAPAVDIYANGVLLVKNLSYKEFSPYMPVPPRSYNIEIYAAGTKEAPVLTQNIPVEEGNIVTVAATGLLPNVMLLGVPEDANEIVKGGNAKFRIVHLSSTTPPVNIDANDSEIIYGLEFGELTNYLEVPAGIYNVKITNSNEKDEDLEIKAKVQFKPEKIYTIYAVGTVDKLELLQAVDGITFMKL